MQIAESLTAMSDPEKIGNLDPSQRLLAGLYPASLGMGIKFLALIVLMFSTSLMGMIGQFGGKKETPAAAPYAPRTKRTGGATSDIDRQAPDDEEIAAAITTALAVMLETSPSSFVVKTIRRVEDSSTAWSRAGLAEQMQMRF